MSAPYSSQFTNTHSVTCFGQREATFNALMKLINIILTDDFNVCRFAINSSSAGVYPTILCSHVFNHKHVVWPAGSDMCMAMSGLYLDSIWVVPAFKLLIENSARSFDVPTRLDVFLLFVYCHPRILKSGES